MDFSLPPALDDIRLRTRAFVADHILSLEQDPGAHDEHENIAELALARVRALAKAQGLWSPQVPVALGGMGLPMVGQAVMYEEANRSIFGPVCFNCAAPDDGNMRLLATVGTEVQKARWLAPIVSGEVRSAFAMTEPAPGGGSDPAMIRTKAERIAGSWKNWPQVLPRTPSMATAPAPLKSTCSNFPSNSLPKTASTRRRGSSTAGNSSVMRAC